MGDAVRLDAIEAFVGGSREPASGSPTEIDDFADAPSRSLITGESLFKPGDLKINLHRIEKGIISVYGSGLDRPFQVIEYLFPGDILGLGYLEHQIYGARAVIATDVKSLPLSALEDVLGHDGRAGLRHAQAMRVEFAHRRDQLVSANRTNPAARVAAFLIAMSQLNIDEGRDPFVITDSVKCGVVADWLGLDLDTLGCALVGLAKNGLIEPCPPHSLRLIDPTRLCSISGSLLDPDGHQP